MKFRKFLDTAQLISHVTDNFTILPRIIKETKKIRFTATHVGSSVSK